MQMIWENGLNGKKSELKTQAFFVSVTLQTHIIMDNSRHIHCSEMSS